MSDPVGDVLRELASLTDEPGSPQLPDDEWATEYVNGAALAGGGDGPRLVQVADVAPERVRWVWPGYFPVGKLVVIDGDPGDGKSILTLDLAAPLSTGSPMPDGAACQRGNSLVLSAEDGLADTIRPGLDAAGADAERIAASQEVIEGGKARPVELPTDLDHLTVLISQHMVRLVIIDSHSDQSVRLLLQPVAKTADATGATIPVVRHLNNSGDARAMYRSGGSIGVVGAARAGYLGGTEPDDDTRRLLTCVKLNVAKKCPALAHRLRVEDPATLARIAAILTAGAKDNGEAA